MTEEGAKNWAMEHLECDEYESIIWRGRRIKKVRMNNYAKRVYYQKWKADSAHSG